MGALRPNTVLISGVRGWYLRDIVCVMPVLHVRVGTDVDTYVRNLAEETGLPMTDVVRLLLTEAHRRGWSLVTPKTAAHVVGPC